MKSVESDLFSKPLSIRFYRGNTGHIVFERLMIIQTWHCDHMRISRAHLISMNRQMDDKGKRAIWKSLFLILQLFSFSSSVYPSKPFPQRLFGFQENTLLRHWRLQFSWRAFGIGDCEIVNPVRVFLPSVHQTGDGS